VPRNEDVWGSGDNVFLTSLLDAGEWSALLLDGFTFRSKPPEPIRCDRRLDGPQRKFGHCGEERNVLLLARIDPGLINVAVCAKMAMPQALATSEFQKTSIITNLDSRLSRC
jgi:hypothetical protein